jgi:hypothetical protein
MNVCFASPFNLKGDQKKTLRILFCFPYILSCGHQIFNILVSTPHNTPLIMGDRDKNFEDPVPTTRVIRRTKYHLLGFYLITLYT